MGRSGPHPRTDQLVMLAQLVPSQAATEADVEAAVVQRAVRGDPGAQAWLFRRHAAHIACLARRSLGEAEVDDIVQETFVQGLGQLGSLREPAKLRSFLVTIAVRRIYARLSVRYRVRALAAQLFRVSPRASLPEVTERVRALSDLLRRARPRHRLAWLLHRIEGYTLPEVAEQTGTSLTTIKRWIAGIDVEVEALDEA
jgi:RNA polymerase sigma-70 factor (ECF subfamily)